MSVLPGVHVLHYDVRPVAVYHENANEEFNRDIAKRDQDDVMTILTEAIYYPSEQNYDPRVSLWEHENINALTVKASGTLVYGIREFEFSLESGDGNGTNLLYWYDVAKKEK